MLKGGVGARTHKKYTLCVPSVLYVRLLLERLVAAVPSGEEIGDEVFDFFFIEVVEQCGGHEGYFGDVAFGDFGAGDALRFVGLGDVSGEVDFLVVTAGFTTKKNGTVFEGEGHSGMLFGDDEGGLQDLGEQAIGFEFAAY